MTSSGMTGRTLDLPPITVREGLVRRWLAPVLSAAILVAALWQLRDLRIGQVLHDVPASPLFWLVFVIGYIAQPASEWVIFRWLWRLPVRGFGALVRKRVSNEIVLGYSGELYFYGWARRHVRLVGAPFGAVKDVAILSAAVGNICTLSLVAVCWRVLEGLRMGPDHWLIVGSTAAIAIPSALALLFRRRLFTLAREELGMIAVVHLIRIVATTLLAAVTWALVMPGAPIGWWVALAALRLLVSRLPFLPNKDIVFAGLVAFAVGQTAAVTAMLAMLAGLLLATHLLLGAALAAADLLSPDSERRA